MSNINNKNSCESCKYFANSQNILGSCQRFPSPQNKHQNDWCGEYSKLIDPMLIMAEELTRESIIDEVSAIKAKPGRPKKNA